MDPFRAIVERLPHLELERQYRERREPGLRDRVEPPDERYPMPAQRHEAAQPTDLPLHKLVRAALGQCVSCNGWLDTEDPARCLRCQLS